MNVLNVLVFLFTVELSSSSFIHIRRCKAATNEVCVEIKKCPYFVRLLQETMIPRPPYVIRDIARNQCGFQNNAPKVCCTYSKPASSPVYFDGEEQDEYEEPTTANAVDNHPNRNLLPEECGSVQHEHRIFRGRKSTLGEFPWMALIAYKTKSGMDFKCGGSLINDRYVLTAAHCLLRTKKQITTEVVGVRLGEHNINTNPDCDEDTERCAADAQDFYIEDFIIHPDYERQNLENDVALIRLSRPVNFSNSNIQPICLPLGELLQFNLTSKNAVVSGWGVTETGYRSAELIKVNIPVLENSECARISKRYFNISAKQVCAGGTHGRDSCSGDSGGPLVMEHLIENTTPRYVQHGIVSYGPKYCGHDNRPGIYTRTAYYVKWILDNIRK